MSGDVVIARASRAAPRGRRSRAPGSATVTRKTPPFSADHEEAGTVRGDGRELAVPWCQVTARVARQVDFGAGHLWLDLDVSSGFEPPAPGQFVQLLLGSTAAGTFLPRPMSVAGAVRRGRGLRLSFLYAPVGTGTRALARLRAGDDVQALGPLGRGYPIAAPGTPVLVAGGRGVAPLLYVAAALARQRTGAAGANGAAGEPGGAGIARLGAGTPRPALARHRATRRCEFLFGARTAPQLVGLAEVGRRIARLEGALHVCTDDGSRGMRGTVVQLLERLAPGFALPIVIHACGPPAMLRAVAEWAVARDIRAYLAMESVMACGTGVCRGCPLPRSAAGIAAHSGAAPSLLGNREYAMCCTEGPVFEARELDWTRVA